MQKFSFKLKSVLRHKQWLEDEAKRKLGLELQKMDVLKRELDNQMNEHSRLLSHRGKGKDLSADQHLYYIHYSRKLLQDMEDQKQLIEEQELAVNQKTHELNAAMTERKKIEKLKDRSFEKYRLYQKRKNAQITDEITSNFSRRFKGNREHA